MSEKYSTINEAITRVHELFLEEVHHYRKDIRIYDSCLECYYLLNDKNGVLDGIEFEGKVLLTDPEEGDEDEELTDEDYEQMFLASLRPNLETNKRDKSQRKRTLPMRPKKPSDLELTAWVLETISVKDEEDRK